MKKNLLTKTLYLAVITLLAVSLLLTGCKPTVDTEGTATFVIANDEGIEVFEVPLDALENATGALDALEYLKNQGKLDYTCQNGGYGAFLTEVGHVKEDGSKGIYIGLWTSVAADIDTSIHATTKQYNGVTLTSSGKGISSMSLTDGCIIYISEIVYG